MRIFGKVLGGLAALVAAVIAGAAVWFWFYPLTVNNAVNKFTIEFAANTPELLTGLGAIDNTALDFHSGKLSDYTKARDEKDRERLKNARKMMDRFNPDKLKGQEKLTWEISTWFLDDIIEQASFDYSGYRVNQISGPTVDLPQFLTDIHVIKNERSVKRYLSRLNEFSRVLSETKVRVEDDRAHGVTPPDFIIDKAIGVMQSFIEKGAAENPLVTTLPAKLDKIEGLSDEKKSAYVAEATKVVNDKIIPGYQAMIALFEDMGKTATHDAGIWRIPEGEKIYAAALRSNTTTNLTADEIHEIGVSEVNRIEAEMDAILQNQGLADGPVSDRVKRLMQDPAQQFPNTDDGRQQLLDFLNEINTQIMAEAPKYFVTIPEQQLEIVRVPEYSQDSSPGGYYNPPALDGSRPGRFYINLKNTADNPRFTLPTLFYHEGVPGHHFQLSASQLIKGVPLLRKVSPFSAYSEGWALYAERIAKTDMHRYDTDPLGDLGRLQAEMFRAVRLVVDTGMHSKRWSREEAIDYMISKTGMTEDEVTREIERYVVWPGQACAYKTGQLAILRARARAEKELGEKFDLRQFHELVLGNGAMPLGILDNVVDDWVEKQKGPDA